jgi:hypothetical protein
MRRIRPALPLALLLAAAAGVPAATGQPRRSQGMPQGWTEVKCARYAESWSEVLARFGREGLGPDFIARHEAFLAAGCQGRREVCPRTEAELRIADVLTIAAMNAGAASSFLPFACRD